VDRVRVGGRRGGARLRAGLRAGRPGGLVVALACKEGERHDDPEPTHAERIRRTVGARLPRPRGTDEERRCRAEDETDEDAEDTHETDERAAERARRAGDDGGRHGEARPAVRIAEGAPTDERAGDEPRGAAGGEILA